MTKYLSAASTSPLPALRRPKFVLSSLSMQNTTKAQDERIQATLQAVHSHVYQHGSRYRIRTEFPKEN
jgi:hypothetical protein